MTFAEEGDDMLMGFKGGGLRLKESKILPALAKTYDRASTI